MTLKSFYFIDEIYLNEYSYHFLSALTILAIVSAISVITVKNPVVSILYLIGLFSIIASYIIFIGLYFLGISYLLVYIGAISILFLFIIMLINVRVSELHISSTNSIPLAAIIVILFSYPILNILPLTDSNPLYLIYNIHNNTNNISVISNDFFNMFIPFMDKLNSSIYVESERYVSSNSWDLSLIDTYDVTTIGTVLYTSFAIWLIVVSLILLISMIGAIVIIQNTDNDQDNDHYDNYSN